MGSWSNASNRLATARRRKSPMRKSEKCDSVKSENEPHGPFPSPEKRIPEKGAGCMGGHIFQP